MSRKQLHMDSSLLRLRRVLLLSVGMFVALSLINAAVSKVLYDEFTLRVRSAYHSGIRMLEMGQTATSAHQLALAHYSLMPADIAAEAEINGRASLARLHATQEHIYATVDDGAQSPTTKFWTITGNQTTIGTVTENNLVWMFVAKTTLLFNSLPRVFDEHARLIFQFLRLNNMDYTLNLGHLSVKEFRDHAILFLAQLEDTLTVVSAIVLLPLFAAIVLGYGPAIRNTEHRKLAVLLLFLRIPRKLVLHVLASKRKQQERDELGGAESEQEEDGGPDEPGAPTYSRPRNPRRGGGSANSGADGNDSGDDNEGEEVHTRHLSTRARSAVVPTMQRRGMSQRGRVFKHSRRGFVALFLKFSLLYGLVVVYFGGNYVYASLYTRTLHYRAANVVAQTLRYAHVTYTEYITHQLLTTEKNVLADPLAFLHSPPPATPPNDTLTGQQPTAVVLPRSWDYTFDQASRRAVRHWDQKKLRAYLETELFHLINLGEGLLFGTTRLNAGQGVVGLSKDGSPHELRYLNLENACLPGMLNCTNIAHGAFTAGLQGASREFVEQCRTLVLMKVEHNVPLPDILASKEYRTLYRMAALFRPPMERASDIYLDLALRSVENSQMTVWAAATVFCMCCVLLYMFVYRSLLRTLDVQIKNTHLLLLLVPDEVLMQVPAIKQHLRSHRDSKGSVL